MNAGNLIEALSAIATSFLALGVWLSNKAQADRSHRLVDRASRVEDQKFRSALLDRRSAAIENVRLAISSFWTNGAFTGEDSQVVILALRTADLVFDEDQRAIIADLLSDLRQWQAFNRKFQVMRDAGSFNPARDRLADQIFALEGRLLAKFDPIINTLNEATRVRTVPPLLGGSEILERGLVRLYGS